jgi:glycyl-tRNA synthetase beta chain
MPDFLLEIGCEEIPARMIGAASGELRERVAALLSRERLAGGEVTHFDTPRRLAVMAAGIAASQADIVEQVNGPSVNDAYKDGQPTPAAHAFAKKAGVDVAQLEKVTTPKGEYLSAKITKKGRSAAEILAERLPKELSAIYWPKNMYWQKPNERFVRPVRWLVAMLDGETIPLEFDGIRAGKTSRGHRILAATSVAIPRAGAAYVDSVRAAKVLGRAEREHQIRQALDAATRTIPGARWREDKALLDTVVNLTEFPSAILGSFDAQFLALPEEVLVTVMRDHQKYFAVEDAGGKLASHFLAVLNTDSDPQGLIRHGNERVLRARFNDARFFWETDQKKSLLERLESLKQVTFQKDLGSYFDKTQRVQRLCSWLSEILRQSGRTVRPGVIHKAACLSKTDLTTELVKEFTELQGIVGGLYARAQQLDPTLPEATRVAIADAIYDHYKPESTDDDVPRSIEGSVLSIGDKADTIAGMFALGLVPSGSKDPFALRRQANAIVKVIAEKKLPLRLGDLMRDARTGYQKSEAEKKFVCSQPHSNPWKSDKDVPYAKTVGDKTIQPTPIRYADNPDVFESEFNKSVQLFFRERLEFYLKDVRGYAQDVVKAVLAADADDVVDAISRAGAVQGARSVEEFESVLVAFKRIKNILKQAREKQLAIGPFERTIATHKELDLYDAMQSAGGAFAAYCMKADYENAIAQIARLRHPLDAYFESILVMDPNAEIRTSRLGFLQVFHEKFSSIADFSEIVTEGKA